MGLMIKVQYVCKVNITVKPPYIVRLMKIFKNLKLKGELRQIDMNNSTNRKSQNLH
jgi:hypothetical protein